MWWRCTAGYFAVRLVALREQPAGFRLGYGKLWQALRQNYPSPTRSLGCFVSFAFGVVLCCPPGSSGSMKDDMHAVARGMQDRTLSVPSLMANSASAMLGYQVARGRFWSGVGTVQTGRGRPVSWCMACRIGCARFQDQILYSPRLHTGLSYPPILSCPLRTSCHGGPLRTSCHGVGRPMAHGLP
jgi:hypothetical protein